jgi:uncharacterized protein YecT (DUF1311 family)
VVDPDDQRHCAELRISGDAPGTGRRHQQQIVRARGEDAKSLNRCAATELGEVQHQLKVASAALPFAGLARAAQSRFVTNEKSECAAAATPNRGGSIYPLIFAKCEIRLTIQWIQEIRQDQM